MKTSLPLFNQRGQVTLDYLFAFVLVGGFSLLIFALSITLSTVEIVQYMTFASARSFYAGNVSPKSQIDAGDAKFKRLQNDPVLAPLFKNGWFTLDSKTLKVGSVTLKGEFPEYQQDPQTNLFHGTVIYMIANVLDFKIPFFGSTSLGESNGREQGFGSYIGSYLGRETTFQECENFNLDRWKTIRTLENSKGAAPYTNANAVLVYIPSDNGC